MQIPEPEPEPVPAFLISSKFGPRPAIPDSERLHRLEPAQQQAFLSYFNDPANAEINGAQRLFNYMEQRLKPFSYLDQTLNASQALSGNAGNCMTLAIMTTALAHLADISISYQLIEDLPAYEFGEDLVIKGVHLRSVIHDTEWIDGGLIRHRIKIDYFSSGNERFVVNVSELEYLATYYRNIAVEALEQGDLDRAYWYAAESLQNDPKHPDGLNLLAISHRRAGNLDEAEEIYRYGLQHSEDVGLMKNYRLLLALQGRHQEVEQLTHRLRKVEDVDPSAWVQTARHALRVGDYVEAMRNYRDALEHAPYAHELYLELGQAYFHARRFRQAEQAMKKAVSLVSQGSDQLRYQAKLDALSRYSKRQK